MPNRKTAIVYFTLGHSLVLDTETIELVYKKILSQKPKIKKHIAVSINLKAIPTLQFQFQASAQ